MHGLWVLAGRVPADAGPPRAPPRGGRGGDESGEDVACTSGCWGGRLGGLGPGVVVAAGAVRRGVGRSIFAGAGAWRAISVLRS